MKLLSIEYIPGVEFEALGIVKGTVVQTKNVGKDFMAGMKTLVGGEITGYTEMLNEARQIATKRMVDEAKEMNADAVIGVKYGLSSNLLPVSSDIIYGRSGSFHSDPYQKTLLLLPESESSHHSPASSQSSAD